MSAAELTDIERLRSARLFRLLSGETSTISKPHVDAFIATHPSCKDQFSGLLTFLETHPTLTADGFSSFLAQLPSETLSDLLHLSLGSSRTFVSGSAATGHHSYEETEKEAFAQYIQDLLGDDESLASRFPITDLFAALRDGVLLCKLVNKIKPDTIPKGKFTDRPTNSVVQMTENCAIALHYAKTGLGCRFQNIGAVDIVQGNGMLILACVWQLIKLELGSKFTSLASSGSFSGASSGKAKAALSSKSSEADDPNSPEAVLIRWVNERLISSSCPKLLSNFSTDIKDSVIYIYLLNNLAPTECPLDILEIADLTERATRFLEATRSLGCGNFVSPSTIVKGNSRMNFAFLASLYSLFGRNPDQKDMVLTPRGGPSTSTDISSLAAASSTPTISSSDVEQAVQKACAALEAEKQSLLGQLQRAMHLVKQQAEQTRVINAELESTKNDLLECLQQMENQDSELSELRKVIITQDEEVNTLLQTVEKLDQEKLELTQKLTALSTTVTPSSSVETSTIVSSSSTTTTSTPSPASSSSSSSTSSSSAPSSSSSSSSPSSPLPSSPSSPLPSIASPSVLSTSSPSSPINSETDKQVLLDHIEALEKSLQANSSDRTERLKGRAEQLRLDVGELANQNSRLIERLQYLQSRFDDDLALARAIYQDLAAESFTNPQRVGMLTKQGGSVKSWKRRWFILKDNFLFYFKTNRDPKPLGVIHLDEFQVDIAKPEEVKNATKDLPRHCFKLASTDRTYFICSERQIDMDLWIDQIRAVTRWYLTDDSRFRSKLSKPPTNPSIYDDY